MTSTPQDERLREALARGKAFLVRNQDKDGSWRDFELQVGVSSGWITGLVGRCLAASSKANASPEADSALDRARCWLMANEKPREGGWGYNENTYIDSDSIAQAVLFLCRWPDELPASRLADLLRTYQTGDGGFRTYRLNEAPGAWTHTHVDVTAVAGLALARLGDRAGAVAARDYCLAALRTEGAVASHWWKSSVYTPAMTALFLRALSDPGVSQLAVYPPCYESAFDTALSAILASQIGRSCDEAVERLLDAQRLDGSWPSSPQLSNPLQPKPWSQEKGYVKLFSDHRRIFTTAIAVFALACVKNARDGAAYPGV